MMASVSSWQRHLAARQGSEDRAYNFVCWCIVVLLQLIFVFFRQCSTNTEVQLNVYPGLENRLTHLYSVPHRFPHLGQIGIQGKDTWSDPVAREDPGQSKVNKLDDSCELHLAHSNIPQT